LRDEGRAFVTVQLNDVKTYVCTNPVNVFGGGIDEQAHNLGLALNPCRQSRRLFRRQIARTLWEKHKPHMARPAFQRRVEGFGRGQPADFGLEGQG
jgi:hypothetical protein